MDSNVGWDVDLMIDRMKQSDREQKQGRIEGEKKNLVAKTHPESPRKP